MLARVFVELAGALVGEVDIHEVMLRLAEHCVDLLGATACGVLLADARGALQVLAVSPESAAVLELLQLQAWLVRANGRQHRALGCRPVDRR